MSDDKFERHFLFLSNFFFSLLNFNFLESNVSISHSIRELIVDNQIAPLNQLDTQQFQY